MFDIQSLFFAVLGALVNEFLSWYNLKRASLYLSLRYLLLSFVTAVSSCAIAYMLAISLLDSKGNPYTMVYFGFSFPYLMRDVLKVMVKTLEENKTAEEETIERADSRDKK